MMDKPQLRTLSCSKPYKLQYLSEDYEIQVNRQVFVSFNVGKYKNEVLFDVMKANHILLGRP